MGFDVVEGPDVELEEYNFDRLRIPAGHPARDMWDTIWVSEDGSGGPRQLLRTHTSPMQIRYLERREPPIRVIVPGTCYRYEATDATHEWMLTQIEGLVIDEDLSLPTSRARWKPSSGGCSAQTSKRGFAVTTSLCRAGRGTRRPLAGRLVGGTRLRHGAPGDH